MEVIQTHPDHEQFPLFLSVKKSVLPSDEERLSHNDHVCRWYPSTCYVVLDNGIPVARAAHYENKWLRYENVPTACIGNYDCIDDPDASAFLLKSIINNIHNKGIRQAVGPMNGCTWESYRFSLHNDFPNFYLEPYNPEYYNNQFVAFGFQPIAHYLSLLDQTMQIDQPQIKQTEKRMFEFGLQLKGITSEHFQNDLKVLYPIVTKAFEGNFLYTPIDKDSFIGKYNQVTGLIHERYSMIAEDREGKIIGFVFAYPDYKQSIGNSIIIKTLAVHSEDRKWSGLGRLLVNQVMKNAIDDHYTSLIHAFIHQHNMSINISKRFHGESYKTYNLYVKSI